jgi:Carboxypeptidase regulatory-like domain
MKTERPAACRTLASFACGFLLLISCCVAASAQSGTSAVRGTITDQQGNAVAGATVTLSDAARSFSRTQTTNEEGAYAFTSVPPGKYELSAEAKGFKKAVISDVAALVSATADVNVHLEVGNVSEVVSVAGASDAIVNRTDATIGNNFTERQILQLPLEARNVAGLLSLQPGVTFFGNVDPQGATSDYRNGSVNGGKSDQSNVTLDGVDVNDQQNQSAFTSVLRVTLDSVQEFRVTTTNPNAEQGRSSGAQVSLVTRSGTNQFHGALYEFHRNTIFAANNFFNNKAGTYGPNDFAVIAGAAKVGDQKVPRSKLLRNVFGGTLGGPVIKDRAFFFFNYEGRRDAREESVLRTVPGDDLRRGIFHFKLPTDADADPPRTLTAAQVTALDPLHIGPGPAVLAIFNQYPHPNSAETGDLLNTFGYRFNSPIHLKWNTYTARFDYNITNNGRHTLYWRGVLQNDKDNSVQQFPGEPALFTNLANNKGFAAGYTAVLSSTLTNRFVYGFTRQGFENAGSSPNVPVVTFRTISDLFGVARNFRRISPVHNFVDDVTWVKGNHTWSFGLNERFIKNGSVSLQNSFPSAVTNKAWLFSARPLRPVVNVNGQNVTATSAGDHAMAALLGLVTQGTAVYNYDKTGASLGVGAPVVRDFAASEHEYYAQDSWRVKPNLTLTLGLRYSLYSPPYEKNGNQVRPSISLGDWFQLRGRNAAAGIPSNAAPRITFDLAGPANGKKGFYDWDKNNFAPRFAFSYSPGWKSGFMAKLTGGESQTVIRGGYAIVYDRIGASLATTFDRTNAFGLSTQLTNSSGVLTASTSPRFTGLNTIPGSILLPDPGTGFPATPGQDFAITAAIDDTIRTPYSEQMDLSIERQLPHKFTIEAAYVGRLGKHILVNNDLAMPVNLVDKQSGMDYFTAANLLLNYSSQSAVPKIPFWENLWPNLAGGGLTSSQVAWTYFFPGDPNTSGPDYTTSLFRLDVGCTPGKTCSKFGPYALFNDQYSNLNAWSSIMPTWYHAGQFLLRKRFSAGTQFDLNYTWSKSEDWASVVERNGLFTGSVWNSWNPWLRKAVSDYDVTHNLNFNGIAEVPIGKGRWVGHDMPGWANSILGGWQLSGIWRWTSGLPTYIGNGFQFPTNWEFTGAATAISSIPGVQTTRLPDGPNLFADPAAAFKAFSTTRPGQVGNRNIIRGDGYFSIDTGLAKMWHVPWNEKQTVQFRWEVFNLTNSARFDVNSASGDMDNPGSFGRYSSTLTQPRVMQFGLRFDF